MIGWAAVGLLVSAYDAWALKTGAETMSTAYRRAFRAQPAIVGGATAYVVSHLTGYLPARVDPLRHLTRPRSFRTIGVGGVTVSRVERLEVHCPACDEGDATA